jgi:hypothetical protein
MSAEMCGTVHPCKQAGCSHCANSFPTAFRLLPGCRPVAFLLLSGCFPVAFRILPDCSAIYQRFIFRLLSDCFPTVSRLLFCCCTVASRLLPDCWPTALFGSPALRHSLRPKWNQALEATPSGLQEIVCNYLQAQLHTITTSA